MNAIRVGFDTDHRDGIHVHAGDILPGSIDPRLLEERKAREPEIALHRSML